MNMSEWLFWNEKYNINMYNEQKCKYINFEDVQRELNITHMFDACSVQEYWWDTREFITRFAELNKKVD